MCPHQNTNNPTLIKVLVEPKNQDTHFNLRHRSLFAVRRSLNITNYTISTFLLFLTPLPFNFSKYDSYEAMVHYMHSIFNFRGTDCQ